jgi:hypothetical protein
MFQTQKKGPFLGLKKLYGEPASAEDSESGGWGREGEKAGIRSILYAFNSYAHYFKRILYSTPCSFERSLNHSRAMVTGILYPR